MRSIGGREDVGHLLQSANSIFESRVADRVDTLREALNPSLNSLDDKACSGLQSVEDHMAKTKKTYVDPLTDKISETKETTVKAYGQLVETAKSYAEPVIQTVYDVKDGTNRVYENCRDTAIKTREAYVDPILQRASDTRQVPFKMYDTCTVKAQSVKKEYITDNIERAVVAYSDYVEPSLEIAASIHVDYVKPTANVLVKTACHPIETYQEYYQLGLEKVNAKKEAVLETASANIEALNVYLAPMKNTIERVLEIDLDDTASYLKASSGIVLDHARTARDKTFIKSLELLEEMQNSLHARLSEAFPKTTDIIERSITALLTTTKVALNTGKEVASKAVSTSLTVYSFSVSSFEWSRDTAISTSTFISSTASATKQQAQSFVKLHEENIRYLANVAGIPSYLSIIGLDNKEKMW